MTTAHPVDETATSLTLDDLVRCYEGAIPAVVCTADGDGVPNVTYISRVHQVDRDRIALSNQFMSKTSRNLAVNPVASVLLIDPVNHEEFHLLARYERTERRGPVFERLRDDVDELAEQMGLRDVFRLRAADIFRVRSITRVGRTYGDDPLDPPTRTLDALADFVERVDRVGDLDALVDVVIDGLDRILGYRHASLMLLDETGTRLYNIASCGFGAQNVGAEIELGVGPIGLALAQCEARRTTGLRQLAKYSRTVQRSFEAGGARPAGTTIPLPTLTDADVRIVVPIRSLGQLVGGIVVEHRATGALLRDDERILAVVATAVGSAFELARQLGEPDPVGPDAEPRPAPTPSATAHSTSSGPAAAIRFFEADGSVFVDGAYLIKGVAGRILRTLVAEHAATGREEFTNRELRLDASLDLPGFKDNLESRLILLKRRLDERDAPFGIRKTGRGRFRLEVHRPMHLEVVGDTAAH
jgi:adenylate cyclase